ncbi:MAG TPA: MFS transporter [Steroidobacteraceae bacterium]|jgi:sugar (glycoside-pentoside-hexuronide) transporter|nr:MFS transporter [Steroidobacteraceae bacterium]
MSSAQSSLSRREIYTQRFGYATSDTAGQLLFTCISFYLLKFYTDIAGLSALVAGNILLAARLIDALDAPLWGIVFERVSSRFGKSRPWFLWLSIPFGIAGVLTFATPDLSESNKVIYAATTYILCSVIYTGINTPVTSILSSLTRDPKQRLVLTSFRMVGSKVGVLIVNATLLPCIAYFGSGDDKRGIFIATIIYATGAVILFLVAFATLEERITEAPNSGISKNSFAAIVGNWPWWIIVSSSLFFWVAFISRISVVPYFFQYVWRRSDLTPIANSLEIVSLVSIVLIPWLCSRTSKSAVWVIGLIGSVLAQIIIYAGVAANSLPVVFVGWIASILTAAFAMIMPFSLLADSVDYGEWKTGVRAAGLLSALGAAFCLKAGSGLGGALPAWILSATHYQANQIQSAEAIGGINFAFVWVPAIFYLLALLPVLFYKRFEAMEPQIAAELEARRITAPL